jgi:hypothetical protein
VGKAERSSGDWHGHITALSVAPEYRRLSLARKMINVLEFVSDEIYKGLFVDLYVRCANSVAISMYEGFGYSVYRRVREYYGNLGLGKGGRDEEDAFGAFPPRLCPCPRNSYVQQICANLFREIPSDVQSVQTDGICLSAAAMYHNICREPLIYSTNNNTQLTFKQDYILSGGGSSGAVPSDASSSS